MAAICEELMQSISPAPHPPRHSREGGNPSLRLNQGSISKHRLPQQPQTVAVFPARNTHIQRRRSSPHHRPRFQFADARRHGGKDHVAMPIERNLVGPHADLPPRGHELQRQRQFVGVDPVQRQFPHWTRPKLL